MTLERTHRAWAIQRKNVRGWWTILDSVKRTRRESVAWFTRIYGENGPKIWREQQQDGRVRCVKVSLVAMEGHDNDD